MRLLSDLIISFTDLVNAEARQAKRGLLRTVVAILMAVVAAIGGVAGLWVILWAVYAYFTYVVSPATAALFTGIITLILTAIVAVSAKWLTH